MNRFKHRHAVQSCRRIFWVIGLWPMIVAADDRALSLEEAVDRALQEAPQVAASAAGLDAATARAPSAGRLPDPELVSGVENLPVDTAERFSLTRDFMTMRKIGVIQSLPSREKRRLQSERAEREIAVAHGEVLKTRYEVARAAADAWIARAVDEESLARLKGLKPDVAVQAAAGRGGLASGRAHSDRRRTQCDTRGARRLRPASPTARPGGGEGCAGSNRCRACPRRQAPRLERGGRLRAAGTRLLQHGLTRVSCQFAAFRRASAKPSNR